MKKVLSTIVFVVCLSAASYAFGISAPTATTSPTPSIIDSPQAVDTLVFTGVVKKLDQGTALFTEKEVYPLLGGNFAMVVGKEVNIIGKLIKEGNVEKIIVSRVQFEKR
jgi:hypothetical protein